MPPVSLRTSSIRSLRRGRAGRQQGGAGPRRQLGGAGSSWRRVPARAPVVLGLEGGPDLLDLGVAPAAEDVDERGLVGAHACAQQRRDTRAIGIRVPTAANRALSQSRSRPSRARDRVPRRSRRGIVIAEFWWVEEEIGARPGAWGDGGARWWCTQPAAGSRRPPRSRRSPFIALRSAAASEDASKAMVAFRGAKVGRSGGSRKSSMWSRGVRVKICRGRAASGLRGAPRCAQARSGQAARVEPQTAPASARHLE